MSAHSWTPQTIHNSLIVAAHLPYGKAAQLFEQLTCVPLSGSSLHRLAQQYGGRLVELQAAEAAATVTLPAAVEEGAAWRALVEPDSAQLYS